MWGPLTAAPPPHTLTLRPLPPSVPPASLSQAAYRPCPTPPHPPHTRTQLSPAVPPSSLSQAPPSPPTTHTLPSLCHPCLSFPGRLPPLPGQLLPLDLDDLLMMGGELDDLDSLSSVSTMSLSSLHDMVAQGAWAGFRPRAHNVPGI